MVWFHLKLWKKIEGDICLCRFREGRIWLAYTHSAAFVTVYVYNLVHGYKFHGYLENRSMIFLKNWQSRDLSSIYIVSKFQQHWKQGRQQMFKHHSFRLHQYLRRKNRTKKTHRKSKKDETQFISLPLTKHALALMTYIWPTLL